MISLIYAAIDLKIFSPSEPLGIFIIFIGLLFSGMIFILFMVSTNKESLEDKDKKSKEAFTKRKNWEIIS